MRQLTRKQKRLLDEWFEKNKDELTFSFQADQLPNDLYSQLEAINDTEILFQEITRYVMDKVAGLEFKPHWEP